MFISSKVITNVPIVFDNLGKSKVVMASSGKESADKAAAERIVAERKAEEVAQAEAAKMDGKSPLEQAAARRAAADKLATDKATADKMAVFTPPHVNVSGTGLSATIGADGCSVDLIPAQPAHEGDTSIVSASFSHGDSMIIVGPLSVTVTYNDDLVSGHFNTMAMTTRPLLPTGETEAAKNAREAKFAAEDAVENLEKAENALKSARAALKEAHEVEQRTAVLHDQEVARDDYVALVRNPEKPVEPPVVVGKTVDDPAHDHDVVDPGHDHGVVDPTHQHGVTDPGHMHGGVIDPGQTHISNPSIVNKPVVDEPKPSVFEKVFPPKADEHKSAAMPFDNLFKPKVDDKKVVDDKKADEKKSDEPRHDIFTGTVSGTVEGLVTDKK